MTFSLKCDCGMQLMVLAATLRDAKSLIVESGWLTTDIPIGAWMDAIPAQCPHCLAQDEGRARFQLFRDGAGRAGT